MDTLCRNKVDAPMPTNWFDHRNHIFLKIISKTESCIENGFFQTFLIGCDFFPGLRPLKKPNYTKNNLFIIVIYSAYGKISAIVREMQTCCFFETYIFYFRLLFFFVDIYYVYWK